MVKDDHLNSKKKTRLNIIPNESMFSKKRRQKGFLRALFCCFRPEVAQRDAQKPIQDAGTEFLGKYLLPPSATCDSNKLCLVLDLDETLVHSSFRPTNNADFVVPIDIEGKIHPVYVLKRPHVDEFLQTVGKLYELVLFTASLAEYADPVADFLDKWNVFKFRLFRDSCAYFKGGYVKDLDRLGRDLKKVVIVDNSPASYYLHKNNAVPVASWFEDMNDTQLKDLIPFFEKLATVDNVYSVLKNNTDRDDIEQQNNNAILPCTSSTENIDESIIIASSPISNIPQPLNNLNNSKYNSNSAKYL